MANVVKAKLEILSGAVKNIKSASNKEKAIAFIKLYEERKISNSKTVSDQLFDYIAYEGKTTNRKRPYLKTTLKYKDAPNASESLRKGIRRTRRRKFES